MLFCDIPGFVIQLWSSLKTLVLEKDSHLKQKNLKMASRALAVAASSSAMAADSTTATSARKTTKTYTYKTDASGNVSKEVHTHVDSSSDTSHVAMKKLEERIRILEEDLESGD